MQEMFIIMKPWMNMTKIFYYSNSLKEINNFIFKDLTISNESDKKTKLLIF